VELLHVVAAFERGPWNKFNISDVIADKMGEK
jgi:hypothetical protein